MFLTGLKKIPHPLLASAAYSPCMSLFDSTDILDTDLLDGVGMMGDDFPDPDDSGADNEAHEIEEVTPASLLDGLVEEIVFECAVEIIKSVRWKKENNDLSPIQDSYKVSVRQKQEIYSNPNSIIDLPFSCDHCGRKVSTVRYTYHLERCMRRRKRRQKTFTEIEEEEEEVDSFEEDNQLFEILPPPPPKTLENTNEMEETTEDIENGWNEGVDEDEDDDEEEPLGIGDSHQDTLATSQLPVLGRSKLGVDDLVGVEDDNDDDGFGITVLDGSPLTPPNGGGGLLDSHISEPVSPSELGLEGLPPPEGIDQDDQYGLGFGRDHDIFGDNLGGDDLHPAFPM